MSAAPLRILVGGLTFPWPAVTGGRMRVANVIAALSQLGEIDLFTFVDPTRTDLADPPAGTRLRRIGTVPQRSFAFSPLKRAGWILSGRVPRALAVLDVRDARRRFATWGERYDLSWFHGVASHVALGSLVAAPAIVDLDDLEDEIVRARLGLRTSAGPPLNEARWRQMAARLQDRRDQRLWHDLQRAVAARVNSVVLCSDEDRRRFGAPNCAVIPNGYDAPAQPLGRAEVGPAPVILFAGLLTYPANREAAVVLAQQIAPLLRDRVPAVQIRLVGSAPEAIRRLADPPRVVVTGFVPDITAELRRADLVAVPLRFGGGTRIKILEAFAHRIPVVSTTPGAAGLDVVPGRELLIADVPEEFARACVTLLVDRAQRVRLAEAAQQLFLRRYRWEVIHGAITALAVQVAQRTLAG